MLTNNCQSVRERERKIVFYLKYFNCEVSIVWPGPTHFPNYLFLKSLFDSIQYSDIIRRDSINEYNLSEQFSIIPALCLYESAKDTLEILLNLDNCHLPLSLFVGFREKHVSQWLIPEVVLVCIMYSDSQGYSKTSSWRFSIWCTREIVFLKWWDLH